MKSLFAISPSKNSLIFSLLALALVLTLPLGMVGCKKKRKPKPAQDKLPFKGGTTLEYSYRTSSGGEVKIMIKIISADEDEVVMERSEAYNPKPWKQVFDSHGELLSSTPPQEIDADLSPWIGKQTWLYLPPSLRKKGATISFAGPVTSYETNHMGGPIMGAAAVVGERKWGKWNTFEVEYIHRIDRGKRFGFTKFYFEKTSGILVALHNASGNSPMKLVKSSIPGI